MNDTKCILGKHQMVRVMRKPEYRPIEPMTELILSDRVWFEDDRPIGWRGSVSIGSALAKVPLMLRSCVSQLRGY